MYDSSQLNHLVHHRLIHQTKKAGGFGAVREVCELIMQAQGTFDDQMQQFLTRAHISN